ncbi:uncharacterized protein T28D9.3-like isoform X3 [Anoplophora glabripennis]|uniref:uncharacterized protein T28D9.3-like isoform X3 n=1 Tax=Anoplophora glabripennis TaxID=217634 RepID=UPI000873BAD3|nr:uncharacterized protein T28D9.3-like isoform X3 [Anoplophora glabripennis]
MNNVYSQSDIYSTRGDMCFDNKGMVTPAQSERTTSQSVHVNVTDPDKTQTRATTIRWRRRLRVQHLLNGFIVVLVTTVMIITELGYIPGTKLGYTCNDPLISHKYRGDTVSPAVLMVGSTILPLCMLLLTEFLMKQTIKKVFVSELWFYYKECIIGCTLVLMITEVAKAVVGEHRPHFFDVCEPDTNKNCVNGSFVEDYTCTSTRFGGYFITDSSRSFPSGHSSVSVFIGLFSSYIVQTRLPTVKTGRLLKPFLISVCLTWSVVCSLSRITDRRHHWWDVLAGMTLGALGALYTLKLIHKKLNGIEKSPRISTSTTTLLDVKNKDATSVII